MSIAITNKSYSQFKPVLEHETQIAEWEKIKTYTKEVFSSARGINSLLLGAVYSHVNGAIATKVFEAFSLKTISDPFHTMNLGYKILAAPFICVIGPIIEEVMFREELPEKMKPTLFQCYKNLGFTESFAKTSARITSVFFSAILFGLIHFTNAFVFRCNPFLFLPQVIFATIAGLTLGLAKELSGDLVIPCGIHMGNNILAWINVVFQ